MNNNKWLIWAWAASIALVLPTAFLLLQSLTPDTVLFEHLWATVLTDYIVNTIQLVGLVLLFSAVFALPTAWLVAMCDFPARSYLQWLLMLPLAMPAYVIAYIYTDLFDFSGPIQRTLRAIFQSDVPVGQLWFFDIRNVFGASLMLSLVLFPYLYLIARTAFLEQGAHLFQVSRGLGQTPWQSFRRIALPLCRPAIVVGLMFIGAEALGDFATVHYFSVNTLTTAVYDSWLGHGSLSAAAKISILMLVSVFAILAIERWQRGRQRFHHKYTGQSVLFKLQGWRAKAAFMYCASLVIAGFILPLIILAGYAIDYASFATDGQLGKVLLQTVWLALLVAVITTFLGILFAFTTRVSSQKAVSWPLKISGMSYMMPSTVLAIAVLITMTLFETKINDMLIAFGYDAPGLFLSGTLTALVFAFVVRFQAVANGTIETSFLTVSPSLDMATKSLGKSDTKLLFGVHIPLIKKSLFTAMLLVFIECMKELPAALLLRPFNFDTLATYLYQYVSDEQLEQAALAAILIVLAGLYPVIRLTRTNGVH